MTIYIYDIIEDKPIQSDSYSIVSNIILYASNIMLYALINYYTNCAATIYDKGIIHVMNN